MTGELRDDTLNAYVDGELTEDMAARVANRAAADPVVAARIARLRELKAGVASIVDLHEAPDTVRPRRRAGAFVATAAALLLAIGVGWHLWPDLTGSTEASDPVVAAHDAWADAVAEDGSPGAPDWLAKVMQPTGLRLVRAEPLDGSQGLRGVHYAFVGTNNCRLSLFELPNTGSDKRSTDLLVESDGALRYARWRQVDRSYVAVARNMDATRFTTITTALHEATRTRSQPEADLLAMLSAARQRCLT